MHQIVLDLETQKSFDEVGGRDRLADLGVSLVGIYHYGEKGFATFTEDQIYRLEGILSESNRVIGFNLRRFDLPVLQPYFKNLRLADLPVLDLMEEIEKQVGHRVSLESVSRATLGEGKTGSGLEAIRLYRSGEMEKLARYCLDDVRLTRDLYEFGKKFAKICFLSRDGGRVDLPVNWADPPPPANLTLF